MQWYLNLILSKNTQLYINKCVHIEILMNIFIWIYFVQLHIINNTDYMKIYSNLNIEWHTYINIYILAVTSLKL